MGSASTAVGRRRRLCALLSCRFPTDHSATRPSAVARPTRSIGQGPRTSLASSSANRRRPHIRAPPRPPPQRADASRTASTRAAAAPTTGCQSRRAKGRGRTESAPASVPCAFSHRSPATDPPPWGTVTLDSVRHAGGQPHAQPGCPRTVDARRNRAPCAPFRRPPQADRCPPACTDARAARRHAGQAASDAAWGRTAPTSPLRSWRAGSTKALQARLASQLGPPCTGRGGERDRGGGRGASAQHIQPRSPTPPPPSSRLQELAQQRWCVRRAAGARGPRARFASSVEAFAPAERG